MANRSDGICSECARLCVFDIRTLRRLGTVPSAECRLKVFLDRAVLSLWSSKYGRRYGSLYRIWHDDREVFRSRSEVKALRTSVSRQTQATLEIGQVPEVNGGRKAAFAALAALATSLMLFDYTPCWSRAPLCVVRLGAQRILVLAQDARQLLSLELPIAISTTESSCRCGGWWPRPVVAAVTFGGH